MYNSIQSRRETVRLSLSKGLEIYNKGHVKKQNNLRPYGDKCMGKLYYFKFIIFKCEQNYPFLKVTCNAKRNHNCSSGSGAQTSSFLCKKNFIYTF